MGKNGVYIFVDMGSFYHFCQTDKIVYMHNKIVVEGMVNLTEPSISLSL